MVSSPTCLWWERGPVGHFLGQVPQRSGQLSIGKLTCQNLRQYAVNTNLRPTGHTRACSPEKQNWFSNRGPQPKPTTKNQTTSNRLTQGQPFHVHPKRQATDQPKHWALLSPCQKILSIGGPKIKGQKRNQLGRPSMVRPVLLQFLDTKKMKATNSAKNAIHLWMRQCKPTPKHLLRMVEREVHLECLGASVERPV